MEYAYKLIELQENLPIRLVMHRRRSYSYHWHKELEVFVVLEGSVVIETTKARYTLREGDILIMNSNEIHASHCPGYADAILIVQMDLAFLKPFGYDFSQIIVQRERWIDPETVRRIKRGLASIVLEMCRKEKGYQAQVMSHVYQFISDLLRRVPHRTRLDAPDIMSAVDFNRLNRIIAYVNDNYHLPISLKDVAKEEFLSAYYLSHFFKDKVGLTFSECLNRVRLQKAVELLLSESSMTVTELALSVGFPNVKSFNRCFRNKYQMSPFRYKKTILGSAGEAGSELGGLAGSSAEAQQHQDLYSGFIIEKIQRLF
ncbi:AraC family transcriptional regulator [Paenibacillus soyae]|uniref:AraC family transcriptional regulator n=1 Tax=Paenibacillus soyae TaxID=2969249 RepID=A0A9X2S8R0_9BACL|nr:AraC family transcriptional regulator [Paenibacillus soyae]MCR2804649.1 AraC family transcriptional regulator [Paenibacillus soyae]